MITRLRRWWADRGMPTEGVSPEGVRWQVVRGRAARRWLADQRGSIGPMMQGLPGITLLVLTGINPGVIAATTAANVDTTGQPVRAGDLLFPISIPDTLEARLILQAWGVPTAGTVRLRFANQSAAGSTGAALAYTLGWLKQGTWY